jgi:hypothetical protein
MSIFSLLFKGLFDCVESYLVIEYALSLSNSFGKEYGRFRWIFAYGRLMRKYKAVGSLLS